MALIRDLSRALLGLLFILAVFNTAIAATSSLEGQVVGVSDGDTLTLLTPARKTVKVRLAYIDAPEKNQPYGQAAKKILSDLVFKQNVRVEEVDKDQYGRVVGHVYFGNRWVNAWLVEQGAVWVYRHYNRSEELLTLEAAAKRARLGLWALPDNLREPPWEWRKQEKQKTAPKELWFLKKFLQL